MNDVANLRHPLIIINGVRRLETIPQELLLAAFSNNKALHRRLQFAHRRQTLSKRLELHILDPIRSRLTGIIRTQFLNEYETRLCVEHRLRSVFNQLSVYNNVKSAEDR